MEWLWSFKCGACYVLVVDNNEVTATDALVYYYVHHDDDVDDDGTLALAILYVYVFLFNTPRYLFRSYPFYFMLYE